MSDQHTRRLSENREPTADNETPDCWIYASPRHDQMYLYLALEEDFSAVPETLLQRFGKPRLVMPLRLERKYKLAREDIDLVRQNLHTQGYHLQMPPQLFPVMNHGESL